MLRGAIRLVVASLALAAFGAGPASSAALTVWDSLHRLGYMKDKEYNDAVRERLKYLKAKNNADTQIGKAILRGITLDSAPYDSAASDDALRASLRIANYGATTEPGEPSQGGVMNKTLWNWSQAPRPRRIVVNTFGSAIDTALAAYSGVNNFAKLKRVAFNDDTTVPGVGTKQSLIQFDAKKGQPYSIQIGSKAGEEDDLYVNVRIFPPEGGLSAFLILAGRQPVYDHDFSLDFSPKPFAPTFVLHNSMGKPMQVSSSSDLGPGVVAPAPVTLAAGETKSVTFSFSDAFDDTTSRALSGRFVFTGKVGDKVASVAEHRALIVIPTFPSDPHALKIKVDAQIRAVSLGGWQPVLATLTNVSSKTAKDCFARPDSIYQDMTVAWRGYNLKKSDFEGETNEPFSIAPGETRSIIVLLKALTIYDADPRFIPPVQIGCASTGVQALDASNTFALTSRPTGAADVVAKFIEPVATIDLPASGKGEALAVAINAGRADKLTVRPAYEGALGDPSDTRFGVSICETDDKGKDCLDKPTASVRVDAKANKPVWFKTFVTAPATDPGHDPANRRVFLLFEQPRDEPAGGSQIVGATSIAVKR